MGKMGITRLDRLKEKTLFLKTRAHQRESGVGELIEHMLYLAFDRKKSTYLKKTKIMKQEHETLRPLWPSCLEAILAI